MKTRAKIITRRSVTTESESDHTIKDLVVRVERLTQTQIQNIIRNIELPYKHSSIDTANAKRRMKTTINHMETRARKRPRREMSTKSKSEHITKDLVVRVERLTKTQMDCMTKAIEPALNTQSSNDFESNDTFSNFLDEPKTFSNSEVC